MGNIAIIPARGGSKRIPRKNIKPFLGKPIIAYSIIAALESNLFDEVMVSTEDEEIAEIAIKYGAKIPFKRKLKNADDFATTIDVLFEVLEDYTKLGQIFDYGCCIYPTAPFSKSAQLTKGFELLYKGKFDTVLPVLNFSFPIQRAFKLDDKGKATMFSPQYKNTRSQDLEKAYHDAGQFYWFNTKKIKLEKTLWTKNTGVLLIPEMEAQDIDTPDDWHIAEFKYKLKFGEEK